MDIFSKKWYFKLVHTDSIKSLMDYYKMEDILESLVIAYTPPPKFYNEHYEKIREKIFLSELSNTNDSDRIIELKNKYNERTNRVYSVFRDYFEFKKYIRNFEQQDLCFHEIIPGEARQKMRFDLDIKSSNLSYGEKVKDELLNACYITMKDLCGIQLILHQDVLIFTSHSNEKISYHIIIDNYYFRDNIECKKFYDYAMTMVSDKSLIDHAVYNSMQSFRIVNCTKINQLRFKIFNDQFSFNGEIINHEFTVKGIYSNLILSHSLISYIHDCNMVKIKVLLQKEYINYGDLSDYVIQQIEEKMSNGNFKITGIEGNLVNLVKIETYFCEICKRNHESENPFLVVENEVVFWCCRRARKRMFLFNVDNNYNVECDDEPIFNDTFYQFTEPINIIKSVIQTSNFANTIKNLQLIKNQPQICMQNINYDQKHKILNIPDENIKCKIRRKINI